MNNKKLKSFKNPRLTSQGIEKNKTPIFSQYPAFCFSHVTNNTRYNFKFFGNDKNNELIARHSLDELLEYLSHRSWLQIMQTPKTGMGGYETLDYSSLRFAPIDFSISNDEKVSVIRFGKGDAFRIIGKWKEPIFFIFGYDFNYSAYNH